MRLDDQVLIFDADDTLWENNLRFERAIDAFLAEVAPFAPDRVAARAVLDGVETANAKVHGYGAEMFRRSLGEAFELLAHRPPGEGERDLFALLAASVTAAEVELIAGVAETLPRLALRHHLLVLTKGDQREQQAKLDASGLLGHFRSVHIVPEKDLTAYQQLITGQALAAERTWMIGNSPKSDILPARSAGLNAVFIPNQHTWVLEGAELDLADTGVLHLSSFAELGEHF
ncbi:hydrolase [Streptomyces tateyamensis]|uniref:Hydrolase n=1 Tax=Streptomyces tateyamensis TaxID=565073 RepID=A0A2V4N0Z7_9ACTN|nr:HAD family hydrolase [Streptomyces tateyamensis]PYC77414.1 hydrolase [Streptomyces tateyamensis]